MTSSWVGSRELTFSKPLNTCSPCPSGFLPYGLFRGRVSDVGSRHIGSLKMQEFQENIYFCFIDYANSFDCVDHNKLWKIQEMGIPDHLTCLLRNLCAGQEATVRTGHGTADWLKIGKGVCQGLLGANTRDPTPKKARREKT